MIETIPFKVFMNPPVLAANIAPSASILSMLDGGLVFFGGLSVALIGLVILEKVGVEINTTSMRWLIVPAVIMAILWFIFKNPLINHLVIGF